MQGIDAPVLEKTVTAFDGTRIGYYVCGSGPRTWVIAPGLGTNILCWKHQIEAFQHDFTMVTWDPRGTYRSDAPANEDHLTVEDHVRDGFSVCEAEGIERFVLGGWSMGVQICLEMYHQQPGRVEALVLIHGTYGHVLTTAAGLRGAAPLFHVVLHLLRAADPVVRWLAPRVFGWPYAARTLHALGMLAANPLEFQPIMNMFATIDFKRYLRMILLLDRHTAESYLAQVSVPTLVTAGSRDIVTPPASAEEMHRAIAGSFFLLVDRGTHYTMTEFPDELNRGIREFLKAKVA